MHRLTPVFAVLAIAVLSLPISAHAEGTGSLEGTLEGLGKGPFVLYINEIPGATYPAQTPAPLLGQKNNTYVPHVLPMVVGSKLQLSSSDPELHNIYAWSLALGRVLFNIAMPPSMPGQAQEMKKIGVIKITCNVHKEMLAFVVVLQNPFYAMTEKGATTFTIKGIPAGKRELRIWGEKLDESLLGKKISVDIQVGKATKVAIGPSTLASQ